MQVIERDIPLRLPSLANARMFWAERAQVVKDQRRVVYFSLWGLTRPLRSMDLARVIVTLTRLGPRKLDSDNAIISCKGPRDSVAECLGIDDGDDRIEWRYEQEKSKHYGLRIRIEALSVEEAA